MKALLVVTNVSEYQNHSLATGLWLSEITHLYDECMKNKVEVVIGSPKGGDTPIDPESLTFFMLDRLSKKYYQDKDFMAQLANTSPLSALQADDFDLIYLTGGHGTMYDFVGNDTLNRLIQSFYESGKCVAAVCHGVGGLLDVQLSDQSYLIKDKKLTGYSWLEEALAKRKKQVPFNLEEVIRERGGNYQKGFFPLTSFVVEDKNLLTGQNPFSSKELALRIMAKILKR